MFRAASAIGLLRLLHSHPGPTPQGWTNEEWTTLTGLFRQRKARVAAAQELPIWVNGELARAGNCFGDLPLTVLSAGIQDQEEDPKLDHDHALKLRLHEQLAHLSSQWDHIVVPNSGHNIPDEAPDAVVEAIRSVMKKVQTA